jgi:hypothetical protein
MHRLQNPLVGITSAVVVKPRLAVQRIVVHRACAAMQPVTRVKAAVVARPTVASAHQPFAMTMVSVTMVRTVWAAATALVKQAANQRIDTVAVPIPVTRMFVVPMPAVLRPYVETV